MARLDDLASEIKRTANGTDFTNPLDILEDTDVDFWFVSIAQLLQLGAIVEDEHTGIMLIDEEAP